MIRLNRRDIHTMSVYWLFMGHRRPRNWVLTMGFRKGGGRDNSSALLRLPRGRYTLAKQIRAKQRNPRFKIVKPHNRLKAALDVSSVGDMFD